MILIFLFEESNALAPFRKRLKTSFIEGFSVTELWVDNAHYAFLESLEVISKIVKQAIVIDLTCILGHWYYTLLCQLLWIV